MSCTDWYAAPWAFALWTYHQLLEIDRRRTWVQRINNWEHAYLIAKGFNEPQTLTGEERQRILAEAAVRPRSLEETRARGLEMFLEHQRGKVLLDS